LPRHSFLDAESLDHRLDVVAHDGRQPQWFLLALPTGAYYTWNGTALEGSPIEPDVVSDFDWQDRRRGNDRQLATALKTVSTGISM